MVLCFRGCKLFLCVSSNQECLDLCKAFNMVPHNDLVAKSGDRSLTDGLFDGKGIVWMDTSNKFQSMIQCPKADQ